MILILFILLSFFPIMGMDLPFKNFNMHENMHKNDLFASSSSEPMAAYCRCCQTAIPLMLMQDLCPGCLINKKNKETEEFFNRVSNASKSKHNGEATTFNGTYIVDPYGNCAIYNPNDPTWDSTLRDSDASPRAFRPIEEGEICALL
jgi:hypothetical protein